MNPTYNGAARSPAVSRTSAMRRGNVRYGMDEAKDKSVFRQGWEAVKASWPPMLLIQLIVLTVVVGYFIFEPIRGGLVGFSSFKDQAGWIFILGSGFVTGGFLPEVAKTLVGRVPTINKEWWGRWSFAGLVYGLTGGLVWGLYKFLDAAFGPTTNAWILIQKVAFDMFVFTPFLSIPFATAMFAWRKAHWNPDALLDGYSPKRYMKNVAPGVVMCWFFWGPVVAMIYTLPERLQFVVSAGCQAAWSILFVFMVENRAKS